MGRCRPTKESLQDNTIEGVNVKLIDFFHRLFAELQARPELGEDAVVGELLVMNAAGQLHLKLEAQ